MSNRSNNIWAKAAAGSPGTNIARAQASRWNGVSNEAIVLLVEDKIGSMLEGISDVTERRAAKQIQFDLQNKLQHVASKYGSLTKEEFRLEMVKLAVDAGLTPDPQVSRHQCTSCNSCHGAHRRVYPRCVAMLLMGAKPT